MYWLFHCVPPTARDRYDAIESRTYAGAPNGGASDASTVGWAGCHGCPGCPAGAAQSLRGGSSCHNNIDLARDPDGGAGGCGGEGGRGGDDKQHRGGGAED